MIKHDLLKKVFLYKSKKNINSPTGYVYDFELGAWINKENNEFLVDRDNINSPKPTTKKADIETGEDLKGE